MKSYLWLIFFLLAAVHAQADEFSSSGTKIFYTVQGIGSPVVLIHGLDGSAASNWARSGITAALANNHRVIAMDARGHGSSDKPQTEAEYGAAMVEDVIALKTAVLHPERVQGLLLCGMVWL